MTKRKGFIALLLTIVTIISCVAVFPCSAAHFSNNEELGYLYCDTPGLNAKEFAASAGCTIDKEDSFIICTGTEALKEGKKFTVVVMGDCAPDGKIDTTDIIAMKRHMLNIKKLEGAAAESVTFEAGGTPGTTDYIKLKSFILGLTSSIDVPEVFNVPDFKGKTAEEATALASSAGLTAVFVTVSTGKNEEGKVFEQSVASGKQTIYGNKITLKIEGTPVYQPMNYDLMKAAWLSQFDMSSVYCKGSEQRAEEEARTMMDQICKNLADNGFNTVLLQVRPNGDSFYPSQLFSPSVKVTGSVYKGFRYDPIKIFVEIAHSYKLSVHGWINPMRLMTATEIKFVNKKYKIGEWYQDEALREKYLIYNETVTKTKNYYLNPAYPETRQLVIDGAVELCTKYDIDGVHFDDYFYPTSSIEFDRASFNELGNGRSLSKFRKDNVNELVKGMYSALKAINPNIIFGISPSGNMDNNRGYISADIDTWATESGYVDYLMPQIYWGFNHNTVASRFTNMVRSWKRLITNENVKLYVGLPFNKTLKANRDSGDNTEWDTNKDVLKRMVETAAKIGAKGVCGFSYQSFFIAHSGAQVTESAEELKNLKTAFLAWN